MPRGGNGDRPPAVDEILARFNDMISGLGPDELRGVLGQVFAAAAPGAPDEAPPSRRRPRRDGVVTYRVRVDLDGTKPPLWRRLELASDLFLHEVHDLLQIAFGWTDSHLHRFGAGQTYYGRDTEYYLCPFDVGEGEPGVPESEVRLDEVLVDSGDKLFYLYDFGDGWEHTVALEAVLSRDGTEPPAVCTAGRRPGPAEDCGGVGGYEMLVAATDPGHAHHREAVADYADMFGGDADPGEFAPTPFDIDDINAALAGGAEAASDLPAPLRELDEVVRTRDGRARLRQLVDDADLDRPALIDAEAAARAVRPYTWLLDRVGESGITLTGAGYLPPAVVQAAVADLGIAEKWIGKGNREVQTYPVLQLRESAQRAGLLRKNRGTLKLTSRGRRALTDPVGLWWALAERTPPRSAQAWRNQAGLLLLLTTAANADDQNSVIADLLGAIGWTAGDDTPLTGMMIAQATEETTAVLRSMEAPTNERRSFARAALATWP